MQPDCFSALSTGVSECKSKHCKSWRESNLRDASCKGVGNVCPCDLLCQGKTILGEEDTFLLKGKKSI